jgi:hypothetical protein
MMFLPVSSSFIFAETTGAAKAEKRDDLKRLRMGGDFEDVAAAEHVQSSLNVPYTVTLPSTTFATYRPSLRNCITFLPERDNCAHREFVRGFCSRPRISLPSKTKSTCRSPRVEVCRTGKRFPPSPTAVLDQGLPPDFDERFFE